MTKFKNNRNAIAVFLLLALIANHICITFCYAKTDCETVVAEARQLYNSGRFSQAAVLLEKCLPNGVPKDQREGAYRLLALAYLQQDYEGKAEEAIQKIFDMNRNYTPDAAQDPRRFQEMVIEVKGKQPKTCKEKLFGGPRKFFWIVGGSALAILAVLELIKEPSPEELPQPPSMPTR